MEQEKVVNTITVAGKVTLKAILTACYLVAKELSDRASYQKVNQTFMGETRLYQFLATKSPKAMERLLTSEVHLEKLKHYLEANHVGFSYQVQEDETLLIFEAKNKALVRNALEATLNEVTKTDDNLTKFGHRLERKPHDMPPQEKIAYYKAHETYKGLIPVLSKTAEKGVQK